MGKSMWKLSVLAVLFLVVLAGCEFFPGNETEFQQFTVSFDADEGSEVEDQTVDDGSTANEPEDPTKEGYTFAGWFTDAELENEFDFATKITADTILYAKWDPLATYAVSFDTNTFITVEDQIVEEGSTADEPEDPTIYGYTFAGWYTDEELENAFDFSTEITANTTLFADLEVAQDTIILTLTNDSDSTDVRTFIMQSGVVNNIENQDEMGDMVDLAVHSEIPMAVISDMWGSDVFMLSGSDVPMDTNSGDFYSTGETDDVPDTDYSNLLLYSGSSAPPSEGSFPWTFEGEDIGYAMLENIVANEEQNYFNNYENDDGTISFKPTVTVNAYVEESQYFTGTFSGKLVASNENGSPVDSDGATTTDAAEMIKYNVIGEFNVIRPTAVPATE